MTLFGFGFHVISGLFPVMFMVVFVVIIAIFVVTAVRGMGQWHRNNQSPRLTVDAEIVSRRSDTRVHHHNTGNGAMHHHSNTWYYVTFQVESGDRIELQIPRDEYGYLVEGDRGKLTFQGTRYVSFQRQ